MPGGRLSRGHGGNSSRGVPKSTPLPQVGLVVVAVGVAPGPVFFLLLRTQLAEIAIRIAMIFAGPLVVEDDLVIVPDVIVAVIGVIDPIVMMMPARHAQHRRRQGGGEKKRSDEMRLAVHAAN